MSFFFRLDATKAATKLASAVEKAVQGRAVRNAVLHVDAPRADLRGTWASGVADERKGRAMHADTPFLSASVGKIAMAATAFNLANASLLDLDAPIARWIDEGVLRGLPVVGGDKAIQEITPRMLLANRSGLPDYFDGDEHPPLDGAPSVAKLMVSELERRWSRDELIAYACDHFPPFAAPGERFLYSDLNWDLLGLVFEGAIDLPFHEVVRQRLLEPLGMSQTWYHVYESAPVGLDPIADAFAGDINLAQAPSLSVDQAGGGLATTAADLGRLIRGLEQGTPAALDRLGSDWTEDAIRRGFDYAYGTWRWRPGRIFFAFWRLPELVGVSGANNSFAYRTATGDVIAGTLDQLDDPSRHVRFLLADVLPILARLEETSRRA